MTDFTLSELLQGAYSELGMANISKATGGTTTTVVDTTLSGKYRGSLWKDGAIFVVRDAGGANAAPEGEYERISAYVNNTTTFTVDSAFSAALASGDVYMYVDNTYPLQQMIQLANEGLRSLDMLDLTDITTITMADEQKEYAGAVAWKRSKPLKIYRATDDDTNSYDWEEITDWDYDSADAGSTPLIIFKQQYPTTYTTVKIKYRDLHPKVFDYDDTIREEVHPEVAKWATVVKALRWRFGSEGGGDETVIEQINEAKDALQRALNRHEVVHSDEGTTVKSIELDFDRP